MKTVFRYDTTGHWLKGNTHIHSTASDGGTAVPEIARLYAGAGYDFLFCTDHWCASDVAQLGDGLPLLLMDGIELDGVDGRGAYYHIVCLGRFTGISQEMGIDAALDRARKQDALVILAHPFWSGNTIEEALRHRFHGVEVYNHVCRWLNGKSDGGVYWNNMLAADPRCLAFASDDAHLRSEHPGWNGGWIVANAPARTPDAVLRSIGCGNYYSSCGPQFLSIEARGRTVHARTSPVAFARLVGPGAHGRQLGSFDGKTMTEVSFGVPEAWAYAYIELEDLQGRRAWTNNLFVPH